MRRMTDSGEMDVDVRSRSGPGAESDFSSMLVDYSVADGQAQARAAAVRLGGEKRVENAMNVFPGDARAGVGNFHFDAAVVRGGAHLQHAAARHGVARIQEEIQKNLLQLIGRAAHGGERIAQLFDDLNLRSLQRV